MSWLDDVIGAWRSGRRCLVVCQNRSTLALVRRWAARKGGLLGLEAATLGGLARQVLREPVLAGPIARPPTEEALPPHTEIARRVGDRPGLTGAARRWVQHVRALARVEAPYRAPPWLEELAGTSWGQDDDENALFAFLDAVEAHGRTLSPSASWDRVVAVGFDRPVAALAPWEPWLVERLTGVRPPASAANGPALPYVNVPDVAAEARVAARLALDDPDGTLILVHDTTSARRVRDALARNGLGCTFKDSEALAVHELASAVRRCAPWFVQPPDPPIPLADLAFVLSRTALGRALHPAAEAAIVKLAGEEVERPTRGSLVMALESTRLLDGPLSLWRKRVEERIAEARAGGRPVGVLVGAAVRLALLGAALQSRPEEDVLRELTGEPVAFDPDDFDDVVATLLGEAPGAALAPGGKLGAIMRFLLACRVRVHDDPVARAIIGALRARADWPVSPSHVHHALAGAVDLGVLSDGVDVVPVGDYDERPCRQLVILDAHDHGIARGVTPDPLLDDEAIGALGALAGRHVVNERLRLVQRAVERADRALAIVTERDASGREVVPPIQLDLRPAEPVEVGSYGLGLPGLPESAPTPIAARHTIDRDAPAEPPSSPDPLIAWLAVQATAEWFRDGRAPGQRQHHGDPITLAEIRRNEPLPPAFVRPYLGHADGVDVAALPAGPHSVSRLLVPLARCGYQAFGGQVLGVRERLPIADELDPRELGTVVHRALELAGSALRRTPSEEQQVALVSRLRGATVEAFDQTMAELGTLSAARRVAVEGHRERWSAHWERYVRSRAMLPQSQGFPRAIEEHPIVAQWIERLRKQVPALVDLPDERLRGWLVWTSRDDPQLLAASSPDVIVRAGERDALPPAAAPDLAEILRSSEWLDLCRTVSEALDRLELWKLPPFASAAEVPFGEDVPPSAVAGEVPEGTALGIGPIGLKLGSEELPLRGRIDRVDFVASPSGERFVGVTDYKTGGNRLGWQFRRDQRSLRDPQLLVYAMVIERASVDGRLPEGLHPARTAVVAHDRVKQVVDDPDATTREEVRAVDTWMVVDRKWLGWASRELGHLVDDARAGRWPLRPRADACPALMTYGGESCPLVGACRLRALPARGER